MKISNWCKKLATVLVAGGLLHPNALEAANLGVNLVVNGDFENVDLNDRGDYRSPLILNWTGPNLYAYSHNPGVTGVPDYADGADPPGAGNWYFTSNNTSTVAFTDVRTAGTYYQDIDLSLGASAVAVANGSATYDLSGYMSSYLNDADYGNVQVDFRSPLDVSLGTTNINDSADAGPNNVWSLRSASGSVPVGTSYVRISLFGTHGGVGGGGADGYIDNVSFSINGVPEPSSVVLVGLGVAGVSLFRRKRVTND